jgi:hypothetical protein
MTQALNTSTVIPFDSTAQNPVAIELSEDTIRHLPARVSKLPDGATVSVEATKYLKMYAAAMVFPYVQVVALTGSIISSGGGVDSGLSTLLTFSPDSMELSLPSGAFDISLENVGIAYTSMGFPEQAAFFYDAATQTVKCLTPVFAFCRVWYSRSYYLYTYYFSGSCSGDPTQNKKDDFESGMVYALCNYNGMVSNTSITLSPPVCQYSSSNAATASNYGYNDTATDKVVSTISLEADPFGPPRLVASETNTATLKP